MIKVNSIQLLIIKQILRKYLYDEEIRVFGSRISIKAKRYSDLDLVIVGKKKINPKILLKIKEDFEESDIPFRIDILDWHTISDNFRKIINKNYKII